MKYVFVDFEMNQLDAEHKAEQKICKNEIIEIGAVKLDDNFEEIDSFKTYVKPVVCPISSRITRLTGITDEIVKDAPLFAEAVDSFVDWCEDADVIYAWSENDLRQLSKEKRFKNYERDIDSVVKKWKDFQKEYGKMIGTSKRISLSDAVFYLGENFQGEEHDALWDSRNTAEVFKLSKNEKQFYQIMAPVIDAYKPRKKLTFSIADAFDNFKLDDGE